MTLLLHPTVAASAVAIILCTMTGKSCPHLRTCCVGEVLGKLMKMSLWSFMVFCQSRASQTVLLSGHPWKKTTAVFASFFPSTKYSRVSTSLDVIN